jgi:homotetrameric cytidine deaminase
MDWEPLILAAGEARQRAHSPYSGFAVGAAIRTRGGALFTGCNVENRSYGGTICAERAALVSAVTAGDAEPAAVVVLADADPPAPPCGLCLQCLAEFAGPELPVLLVNPAGHKLELTLGELLPHPFVLPGAQR